MENRSKLENDTDDHETLFRIFLLEDETELRSDIAKRFVREFRCTDVMQAGTVEDGLRLLEHDVEFDVAVSDIRLPMRLGKPAIAHHDVADKLRAKNVVTIFITGWRETDDVEKFLYRQTLSDPTAVVLRKEGMFLSELCRQIRELFMNIASRKIRAMTCEFFGGRRDGPVSGTASLMFLSSTVSAYWEYLDCDARTDLEQQFDVRDLGSHGVQITIRGG